MPTSPTTSVDVLRSAVAGFAVADLASMSGESLLALVPVLESVRRQFDAATARVTQAVEQTQAYRIDGYLGLVPALTHLGRLPRAEAFRRAQVARLLADLPAVVAGWEAGTIPSAHVDCVARLAANRRIRDIVIASDEWFAEHAVDFAHGPFRTLCQQFEVLADEDGAESAADARHRGRSLSRMKLPAGGMELRLRVGDLQAEVIESVLATFEHAEFLSDWAEAEAVHGTETCKEDLDRTDSQRRADAFVHALQQAASTPRDSAQAEPIVNIVVDYDVFVRGLAKSAGAAVAPLDPEAAATMRCHTSSGIPLPVTDVIEAAIVGRVRRVVLARDGVTLDFGRKERLFKGPAREAVKIGGWPGQSPGCPWLDCGVSIDRVEIDHQVPWRLGGLTNQANAWPPCGRHNRLKECGFSVHRTADGRFAIARPGGQPVTQAA